MVSIKDISRACGVSAATVSKALNDQPDISQQTKDRIREKARQMGYSPNAAAMALKTNRTYNIGVLFQDQAGSGLLHDYFASVLNSFKTEAETRGYDITFVNAHQAAERTMSYLEHCRFRRFDGAALICVDFNDPQVTELMASPIPSVMLDFVYDGKTSVISNNAAGIRDLVRFIASKGHKRIAYICDNGDSSVTKNRVSGFFRTMDELGLTVPDEYIKKVAYRDTKAAEQMTEELLALETPPTCICYSDDFTSLGGFNAIDAHGLRIPEDISVAGYDGISWGRHMSPRLTTIRQDTEKMGSLLAEKLIEAIEHPKSAIAESIIVDGILYEGESVGAVSESN